MLFHIVWFLLIGLAAGWLAGQLLHGRDFGLQGDLIVGVLGALLGGILLPIVGFRAVNLIGELISATIGALVFLFLMRKFGKRI
jgi:uncharacterized membrane protein YeaQ/YmgE (transglycosylase-associated protein family)